MTVENQAKVKPSTPAAHPLRPFFRNFCEKKFELRQKSCTFVTNDRI